MKGIAMKKLIALTLVTVGIAASARAQWIVFDPTMNVQSIINTAQEIAKYVVKKGQASTSIEVELGTKCRVEA